MFALNVFIICPFYADGICKRILLNMGWLPRLQQERARDASNSVVAKPAQLDGHLHIVCYLSKTKSC